MIAFRVNMEPEPQPRHRVRLAKIKGKVVPLMYLPEDAAVRKFKRAVQLAARMTYKGEPLQGPLSIDIVAVYQRPKSLCWKTKPMPREWKSSMPDNDNVEKEIGRAHV